MAERKRRPRPPGPPPETPASVAVDDAPAPTTTDKALSRRPTPESLDTLILTTLLCGQTITATAEIVGCSRATIERRLQDPAFRQQLEEARTDMLHAVQSKLGYEAMRSVEVLAQIRDNPRATAGARVRAADRILRLAVGAPLVEITQTTVVGGHSGPAPAERLEAFLTKLQNRGTELIEALPSAPIDVASTEAEAPET
jgi:hypothetical protein